MAKHAAPKKMYLRLAATASAILLPVLLTAPAYAGSAPHDDGDRYGLVNVDDVLNNASVGVNACGTNVLGLQLLPGDCTNRR